MKQDPTPFREAFSPVKNDRLGLDPLAAMRALRDEVVSAGTDDELDGHETAYTDAELRYRPGALRFDVGNYNYLGAAAAGAALELLDGLRIDRVEIIVRRVGNPPGDP